jgi:hypothetical protein
MTAASYEQHVGRTLSLWLIFDKFGFAPVTDHLFNNPDILQVLTAELALRGTAGL